MITRSRLAAFAAVTALANPVIRQKLVDLAQEIFPRRRVCPLWVQAV